MRFQCKAAQLHTPLFLNSCNLGDKLNTVGRTGLELEYDTDLSALIVQYQQGACLVPGANVASATPFDVADLGIEPKNRPTKNVPTAPRALPPTAPAPGRTPPMARPTHPMAAQIQTQRTAQVSHPIRDQVTNVNGNPVAPRKYMPHSTLDVNRAAMLAASGQIQPGAPAPTTADLQAAGILPAPAVQPLTVPEQVIDYGTPAAPPMDVAGPPAIAGAAPRARRSRAKVAAE